MTQAFTNENKLAHRAELQAQIRELEQQIKETALYKIGDRVRSKYHQGEFMISNLAVAYKTVRYNLRKLKKDGSLGDRYLHDVAEDWIVKQD